MTRFYAIPTFLITACTFGQTYTPHIEIVDTGVVGACKPVVLTGLFAGVTEVRLRPIVAPNKSFPLKITGLVPGTLDITAALMDYPDGLLGPFYVDMEQNGGTVYSFFYRVLGGHVSTEPQSVFVSHYGGGWPAQSFVGYNRAQEYEGGPGTETLHFQWQVRGVYDSAEIALNGANNKRKVLDTVFNSQQWGEFDHAPCMSGTYELRFFSSCVAGRPYTENGISVPVVIYDPIIHYATSSMSMDGPESTLTIEGDYFHPASCGPNKVWLETQDQLLEYDLMKFGGVQSLLPDRVDVTVRRRDIPPGTYNLFLETDQGKTKAPSTVTVLR